MWTMVSHVERMSSSEYPAVFMLLKNRIIILVRRLFACPPAIVLDYGKHTIGRRLDELLILCGHRYERADRR